MTNTSGEELPTVIFADKFYMTDEAIKNIERFGKVITVDCETEDEMVKKLQKVKPKVIISEYFKISPPIIDSSPNLRGIIVWGVGYDHIDVNDASERGILVANTRGSNAESVAEHVFALILGLSRKLIQTDIFVRNGSWVSREETGIPQELVAEDLYGKTIGIVGLGAVGTRVARIGLGFGMRVLGYDPYINARQAKERSVELTNLEMLLKESDYVTLHVILNEETRGMIGEKELGLMKQNAYLINSSRGPVIDEEALIQVLRQKRISGAGLDVFVNEPMDPTNPLLKLENVIVSPHVAGNSQDALDATSLVVSQETTRILRDEIPKNLVNRQQLIEKGYMN